MGTGLENADDMEGMGPAECGNGTVDLNELCDDDNEVDADGCNSDCVPSGYVMWEETVGSAVMAVDEGQGIVADDEGNFFVAGYTATMPGTIDGWLRRLSPKGGAYWTVALQGAAAGNDAFNAIALAEMQGVYVAGYTTVADMTYDGWVRKIDRFGAELWTNAFDAPGATSTVINRVATDADGSLLAVGYHDTMAAGNDIFVRKYSPDGMVVWTRSHDGPAMGNDHGYGVAATEDGRIYVSGSETVAGESYNMWLGRYDVDGNLIWERSYNGPRARGLSARRGRGSRGQRVRVRLLGGRRLSVARVRAPLRSRRRDRVDRRVPGHDELGAHCSALARDSRGDLVITGGEMRGMMEMPIRDVLVRKYSADGDVKWTTKIPGGALGPDYGRDVFVGDDQIIYATGSIDTGVDARDIWMARLTP